MSVWHSIKPEDLELDGDEINAYVHDDYSGAVYAVIKISDMLKLLGKE